MTQPLPIPQDCGCPVGEGHACKPSWVTDEEWAEAKAQVDVFRRTGKLPWPRTDEVS